MESTASSTEGDLTLESFLMKHTHPARLHLICTWCKAMNGLEQNSFELFRPVCFAQLYGKLDMWTSVSQKCD